MRSVTRIVKIVSLLNGAEEMGKGRLFFLISRWSRLPIGFHVHEGESETATSLRGTGEYNDNGTLEVVLAEMWPLPPTERPCHQEHQDEL